MKNLLLITLLIASTNIMADETALVCEGVKCKKIPTLKIQETVNKKELTMNDINVEDCLVNLKENKTYRVLEVDKKTNKVVTVLEKGDELKREIEWFDDSSFDRTRKVMACADTDTKILSDRAKTYACIESGGKASQTYFCEVEIRN